MLAKEYIINNLAVVIEEINGLREVTMKSKLQKNAILTAHICSYCLLCECSLDTPEETSDHMQEDAHIEKLLTHPYLEKYGDNRIRKVNKGYFCEFCGILLGTAPKVSLHIQERRHYEIKGISLLKRTRGLSAVTAFDDVLISERAFHSLTEDTCAICNEELEDENIHKTESAHLLKLVQSNVEFAPGNGIYRKTDETSFQCFTCNSVFALSTLDEHFFDSEHKELYAKCQGEMKKYLKQNKTTNVAVKSSNADVKEIGNDDTIVDKNHNIITETAIKQNSKSIDSEGKELELKTGVNKLVSRDEATVITSTNGPVFEDKVNEVVITFINSANETISEDEAAVSTSANGPVSENKLTAITTLNKTISEDGATVTSDVNEPVSVDEATFINSANEPVFEYEAAVITSANGPVSEDKVTAITSANKPIFEYEAAVISSGNGPVSEDKVAAINSANEPVFEYEAAVITSANGPVSEDKVAAINSVNEPVFEYEAAVLTSANGPVSEDKVTAITSANKPILEYEAAVITSANGPVSEDRLAAINSVNEPVFEYEAAVITSANGPVSEDTVAAITSANEPVFEYEAAVITSANGPVSEDKVAAISSGNESVSEDEVIVLPRAYETVSDDEATATTGLNEPVLEDEVIVTPHANEPDSVNGMVVIPYANEPDTDDEMIVIPRANEPDSDDEMIVIPRANEPDSDDEMMDVTSSKKPVSEDEATVYANGNNLTYNTGHTSAFCRICGTNLPPTLSSMKEHVNGKRHKSILGTLKATKPKPTITKKPAEEFIRSVLHFENMYYHDIVINRKYCISLASYVTITSNGTSFRCQTCEVNMNKVEIGTHIKAPRHKRSMEKTYVITSLPDSEFVRQVRPDIYHCGFCNLVMARPEIYSHLEASEHKYNKGLCETRLQRHVQDHLPNAMNYRRYTAEDIHMLRFLMFLRMLND